MPANADSGKTFVIAIIVGTLLMSLTTIFVTNVLTNSADLQIQLVRLAITVALAVQLYRGAGWARWIFIVLFGLAGLGMLVFVFFLPKTLITFIIALMGLVYAGLGGVLMLNPSVRLYFERKALERKNAKLSSVPG